MPEQPPRWPRTAAWVIAGLFILALLAIMPGAWALPEQAPDFQTVPTPTPTPTRPGAGPTATPAATETPQAATATPPPGATATATPPPGAAATATGTSTVTPTLTRAAPAATLPARPGANSCWAAPTPGFATERAPSVEWTIESDQSLVVPGQTVTQRLLVRNTGTSPLSGVLICNPLDPALVPGQPQATQGQARIEPEGLWVELPDGLGAGQTVQVELNLTIPADYPLGGVIESQAWLLWSNGQRASTDLLTWALPPAYLPPTGK